MAVAVALAFVLGAISPFALPSHAPAISEAPAAPAAVAPAAAPAAVAPAPVADLSRGVSCPAGAVVVPQTTTGHLDTVVVGAQAAVSPGAEVDVQAGRALRLGGWIVESSRPAKSICAIVDGHLFPATLRYGSSRPDVATALQNPADTPSGFSVTVTLPMGNHAIVVGALAADGHSVNPMLGGTLNAVVR